VSKKPKSKCPFDAALERRGLKLVRAARHSDRNTTRKQRRIAHAVRQEEREEGQ